MVTPHESAAAMTAAVGYAESLSNPGAVAETDTLRPLIAHAVRSAAAEMAAVFAAAQDAITGRVEEWSRRVTDWTEEAAALIQRSELRQRRVSVEEEKSIAARMVPERQLVRPLLVVVPQDHPVAGPAGEFGRSEVMASSDAIVVGEDWISEHYFTTDAKSESFQAQGGRTAQGSGTRTPRTAPPLSARGSSRVRLRLGASIADLLAGPAGHRGRQPSRAVRRAAPGARLRAAASTS